MAVMIASGGISAAVLANWTLRAGLTRSIATGVTEGRGLKRRDYGTFFSSFSCSRLLYSITE
jgi:hypothetical protein